MDARTILEQHSITLAALLLGGVRRGVGSSTQENDEVLNALQGTWRMEQRLVKRVLRASGDPTDQLVAMRHRTEEFLDKYPERKGWEDQSGEFWNAQQVLEGIDKLVEEIETRQAEDEAFEDDDESDLFEE